MQKTTAYKIRCVLTALIIIGAVVCIGWHFRFPIMDFLGIQYKSADSEYSMTFEEIASDNFIEIAKEKNLEVTTCYGTVTEGENGTQENAIPFYLIKLNDKAPYGTWMVKLDAEYEADDNCTYEILYGFTNSKTGDGVKRTYESMKNGVVYYIENGCSEVGQNGSFFVLEYKPAPAEESNQLDVSGDLNIQYIGNWKLAVWPKTGEFNNDSHIQYRAQISTLSGYDGCSGDCIKNGKYIILLSGITDKPEALLNQIKEGVTITITQTGAANGSWTGATGSK